MRKICFIFCFIIILSGCEHYSDDNTYYAEIVLKNFTSKSVSVSFKVDGGDTRNEYKIFNGITKNEIKSETEEKCLVSWIPGKFTLVTINGGDYKKDAALFITYEIQAKNHMIKEKEEMRVSLISNNKKQLYVFEACVQKKFTHQEFSVLKDKLNPEELDLFKEYYFYNQFGDLSSSFIPWALVFNTDEENIELLKQFDAINEKYGLNINQTFISFVKETYQSFQTDTF